MIQAVRLIGTTDGSGDVVIKAESPYIGRLFAVEWVDGDLADNNTAVLVATNTESAVDYTLLTLGAGEGDNDVMYYPRALLQDLGAADLTAVYDLPIVNGLLQLTIAAGGASKTGGAIAYLLLD